MQTACELPVVRTIQTTLFSLTLGNLIPGPSVYEQGPCGAPLLTRGERKAKICSRCVLRRKLGR
jgi:hypothetical protein